jgi:subtilisin family serine protease|tara:strand:+ start:2756 stop:3592 length:837 start_codon:yes stop_codon:yes gene_type:complete
MHRINFEKKYTKESISKLPSEIIYKPQDFGFSIDLCDKTSVKVGIVDSGAIKSESYKFSKSHSRRRAMSFLEDSAGVYDQTGHATAVAGIIASSGVNGLTGISPHASMYFARCLDEKNNGELSALMSSLLWCMIKKIDIVVISLGLRYKSRLLHDIIKKLYENNICIFSSSGNDLGATKDAEFPARFDEVFACGIGGSSSCSDEDGVSKKKYYLNFKNKKIISLDLNAGFVNFSGSSSVPPVVAGVACHIIESYKRRKEKYTVNDVYSSLIHSFSSNK